MIAFRSRLSATVLLAALAAPAAFARGGIAVDGHDRTRILPPRGAEVRAYENAGYRLVRRGEEVEVEIDAAPLGSTAPFRPPRRGAGGPARGTPIARLARAQTAGAATHYEAVSRILGWVARHIEYDLDRRQPQSAAAVLERRSGYCTGIARLTVALLEAASIEAREVAGYVVDAGRGVDGGRGGTGSRPAGHGYHRWIEAYLPDRGWVFSDPLATHHYVPATYVRLASDELRVDRGIEGLLLERSGKLARVDVYPASPPGVAARRNTARRWPGALPAADAFVNHEGDLKR